MWEVTPVKENCFAQPARNPHLDFQARARCQQPRFVLLWCRLFRFSCCSSHCDFRSKDEYCLLFCRWGLDLRSVGLSMNYFTAVKFLQLPQLPNHLQPSLTHQIRAKAVIWDFDQDSKLTSRRQNANSCCSGCWMKTGAQYAEACLLAPNVKWECPVWSSQELA